MSIRLSGGKPRLSGGKVRLVTPGAAIIAPPPSFTDFGLGLIGQSNEFNRQSTTTGTVYPLGHPDASEFYNSADPPTAAGTLRRIGNVGTGAFAGADKWGAPSSIYGSNFDNPNSGSKGDGPVMLSGLLAAGLKMPVRVINRAVKGSSINSWISIANGGPTSGNCWEVFAAAVALLASQLGTTPAALLRMVKMQQGETDAHTMPPALWKDKVAIVHAQSKALAGNRPDFLFGLYALGAGSFNGSTQGEFGAYRVAAIEYATSTPGAFFAGNTYDAATIDGVHINSEGFHRIDRRAAKADLYALGITSAATGLGGNGAGPRIDKTNTTFAAGVITVNVLHAGGNALLDGAAGTGGSLTTFEIKDKDGNVVPYTSSISGPSQIKLTPTGSYTGPLTLSNAMMNVPCGVSASATTFAPAGCAYDNDGYWQYGTTASTPIGSPLQPCAAFTVTGS
jgi:hypothetical protein